MNTTETADMLHSHLLGTRRHLEELWERIDKDDKGEGNDYEEPRDELDNLPLEIVWEKGEPFAVVLGTGGPHIEIRGGTRHDGNGYALHGYWGGEHVVIRGESITRTGEHFRDYLENAL